MIPSPPSFSGKLGPLARPTMVHSAPYWQVSSSTSSMAPRMHPGCLFAHTEKNHGPYISGALFSLILYPSPPSFSGKPGPLARPTMVHRVPYFQVSSSTTAMAQKKQPGCMYAHTEKKLRSLCFWRPLFAYIPLSTLLFRQTGSSGPAHHGPQSTKVSGEFIHICYGSAKASWVHVRTHRRKRSLIYFWRHLFDDIPLSTLLFRRTGSSSPAHHGPQSTKVLGEFILVCYGPEKASWVHVRTHRKKSRSCYVDHILLYHKN